MAISGTSLTVGVLAEHDAREHRVALDPAAVSRLVAAGHTVLLEYGSATPASFLDWAYVKAGASLAPRSDIERLSTVLPVLRLPPVPVLDQLLPRQLLIGLIDPLSNLESIAALAQRGVTVVALDLLPRTLSRAQAMDALSLQSSVVGYRAAIVAADLPTSASEMCGRNIVAALASLAPSGVITIDQSDDIHRAIVVCHGGVVTSAAVRAALKLHPLPGAGPEKARAA